MSTPVLNTDAVDQAFAVLDDHFSRAHVTVALTFTNEAMLHYIEMISPSIVRALIFGLISQILIFVP